MTKPRAGALNDTAEIVRPAVKALSISLSEDGSIFVMDRNSTKEVKTKEEMYMLIETLMKYFKNNSGKKGIHHE